MGRSWPAFLLMGAFVWAGCSNEPITITLEEGAETASWVRVGGLTAEELDALRTAVWREEGWQTLLSVAPSGSAGPPLPGRYIASREALEFHPREPLEPGRSYVVHFDPARLPLPRTGGAIEVALTHPGRPERLPAVVTSISPEGDLWPSNLLRFYVHFSAPMSRTEGLPLIRLFDDHNREVPGLVAPSPIDFWNADRTRYTGFLARGRALGAHASGLEEGREYTLVVDTAWRDAEGRPLAEAYRSTFRVGPPVNAPLIPAHWRISAPPSGTRESLVVHFPRALDEGLLERSLAVASAGAAPLDGTSMVAVSGAEWRFTPSAAWRRDAYELLVLSTLEDPAGNRIGEPADQANVPPPDDEPAAAQQIRLPFLIK